MSIFSELESVKYNSVLDLIKREESHDKKRNVLTGEEIFQLCQDRYYTMQELLLPLKRKLGENIEIVDIAFAQGMQDDTSIIVWYNKDGKQNYFIISNMGLNDIEISSSDNRLEKYGFVMSNKKIILDIFNKIFEDALDSEFYINSTSKKFLINDNCKSFIIKDINGKLFSVEGLHSSYVTSGLMYNKDRVISYYQKLRGILLENNNITDIYKHIRVYEDEIPKMLKKTNQ